VHKKPINHTKLLVQDVVSRTTNHNLSLVAAGVAFYAFLSVFPAIATVISVYGLIADAETVQQNISDMSGLIPPDARNILTVRMQDIANNRETSLTLGLIAGIAVSLWSANRAMKATAQALNVAFDEQEDRSFLMFNLITLGLTIVSSFVALIALIVVVLLPVIVSAFLSQDSVMMLTVFTSWSTLILMLTGVFVTLYRYAPSRNHRPQVTKSLPGALFSTLMIVVGSIAFSFYVSNFGSYDEQYGTIGAVVVTMLWLYLCSYIFLLGAEVNAARFGKAA